MIPVDQKIRNGASLIEEIERRSGQKVSHCYQCGRCTSTCTGSVAFDYPPHRFMRLLQLGMVQEALRSTTAHLCYDCMTCSLRCPMSIDVANVIETVRNIADEMEIESREKELSIFHQIFLKNVKRHGRLHEGSLLAMFNLRTRKPFNDFSIATLVLRKKKVHIMPPRIKNLRAVRRMFKEVDSRRATVRGTIKQFELPEEPK